MAVAYSLFKSLRGKDENPIGVAQIDAHQWIVLLIGLVVSFVVAYGAVAWFMGWVRKRGFAPFAVYRIILGAVILYYLSKSPDRSLGAAESLLCKIFSVSD